MARRWFQIHLSTAIVMMFAAGGLIWLNVCARDVNLTNAVCLFWDRISSEYTGRGWPLVFYCAGPKPMFSFIALGIDIVLAQLFFGGVALLSEFFIRRRESRNEGSK